jgi:molybdate transport system regulatory protein
MKTARPQLAEALGHEVTDKRIDILRRIGVSGSISEAARGAGVSYKAAWQALETLNNLAGTALVEKVVGGSGGGGARLTAAGDRVLQAAGLLSQSRSSVLALLEQAPPGQAQGTSLAALGLRTSMRNQFPCQVQSITRKEGLLRVALALPDGALLLSRITRESSQLLGLSPGMAVLALCKATAVQVAQSLEPSASRNVLHGVVSRLHRSTQGGEVSLGLGGGLHLVGFAAAGHGLKTGQSAMASIEESGVVIALSH